MKPHEIERHQAQANHLEIVLHLRADLLPCSRYSQELHKSTGR